MSKLIASAAIKGSNALIKRAEEMLEKHILHARGRNEEE